MSRRLTLRTTATVFVALLLLILALALWLTFAIRSPFPQTSGTITLDGLVDEVSILRDELGVAHIYAENDADLFFAQGYTHAQDRFWQMEFWRHIGLGRISEIVGEATLEDDKFIRNAGWPQIAAESVDYYRSETPEIYALMEAYSAGVNAWLAENRDNVSFNQRVLALSAGPWEIEPWEPLHTIAWGTVMAWDLRGSSNISDEQRDAILYEALGPDLLAKILPGYPDNRPIIVDSVQKVGKLDECSPSSSVFDPIPSSSLLDQRGFGNPFPARGEGVWGWGRLCPAPPTNLQFLISNLSLPSTGFALGSGDALGSNSWVVSGEHTASGLPLLANDPHLGVQLPSIWYWNGLHAPGWNVVGMSFAGVPGVIIGHNADIAWGVTNMSADSQDLYIERLNPDNPLQYEFEGQWRDMAVRVEEIGINGGDPVTLTVRETHHGPLLNNVDPELTQALALRWAADRPTRLFQAVIELNQAANYDDFRSALSKWDTAPQNVVYADREGNIAYQSTGRYPIRPPGVGPLPVPGWTGEFEWRGFIPYDEMPRLLNPAPGFIVTANNAIVNQNGDDEFPYYLARYWASGDRAQRIETLLREAIDSGDVTIDTLQQIQGDSRDLLVEDYLPLLQNLPTENADVQTAIKRLRGWNGQLDEASVAATIFEAFLWKLSTRLVGDEATIAEERLAELTASQVPSPTLDIFQVDEIIEDTGGEEEDETTMVERVSYNGHPPRVLLHQVASQPDNALWDDVTTEAVESREEILALALADAVAYLAQRLGRNTDAWRWARVHTITFRSSPLGESGIGPLERLVNRGPFPVAGGDMVVNANGFEWGDEEFGAVTSNPSVRFVVDFADFDSSRAIHPIGQSGHPFHPHYSDMIEPWLRNELHPFVFSRDAVEQMATERLVLAPQRD